MTNKLMFWPAVLIVLAILLASSLLVFLRHPESGEEVGAVDTDRPAAPARLSPAGRADEPDGGGFTGGFAPAPGAGLGEEAAEEPDQPMQPWEIAINKLLDSDEDNSQVAASLAALAPSLPFDGQLEAVQHMVNLTDDENYSLASNMLLQMGWHPDLRAIVFSDVLDRPNAIKLPVLLAILGNPADQLRGEAHTNLQAVIGQDFGPDAKLWAPAVQELLAREQAEQAAQGESAEGQ